MPEPDDKLDPAAERRRRLAERWKKADPENQPPPPDPDPEPEPVPDPEPEPEPEKNEEEPVPTAVIDPPNTEQQPPQRQPRGTVAGKEKLQPYVAADVAERARNAWWRTRSNDDCYETFSDLIEAAILEKVEEMEARFNNGVPFEPRPRKKLSSGRPVGR